MKYKTGEMYRIINLKLPKTGCAQRIKNGFWVKWHDASISFISDITFNRKRFMKSQQYEAMAFK